MLCQDSSYFGPQIFENTSKIIIAFLKSEQNELSVDSKLECFLSLTIYLFPILRLREIFGIVWELGIEVQGLQKLRVSLRAVNKR